MGCPAGKGSWGLATPLALASGGFAASPRAARQSPRAEQRGRGGSGRHGAQAQEGKNWPPGHSRRSLALPAATVRAWRHLLSLLLPKKVPEKAHKAPPPHLLLEPGRATGAGLLQGCRHQRSQHQLRVAVVP